MDPRTIATIAFIGGQAIGFTGCNRYQAPYTVDAQSISLCEAAQASLACDPSHVEQGDAFIRATQAVDRFVILNDSLESTDAEGAAQLVSRPATELPLMGVAWQLVWSGRGTSPLDGSQISLAFRT